MNEETDFKTMSNRALIGEAVKALADLQADKDRLTREVPRVGIRAPMKILQLRSQSVEK
jgi:hypothetical protein